MNATTPSRRRLSIAGVVLLALVVLLLAAAAIVPPMISSDWLKAQLYSHLHNGNARNLHVGQLSLRLLPTAELTAEDVQASSDGDAAPSPEQAAGAVAGMPAGNARTSSSALAAPARPGPANAAHSPDSAISPGSSSRAEAAVDSVDAVAAGPAWRLRANRLQLTPALWPLLHGAVEFTAVRAEGVQLSLNRQARRTGAIAEPGNDSTTHATLAGQFAKLRRQLPLRSLLVEQLMVDDIAANGSHHRWRTDRLDLTAGAPWRDLLLRADVTGSARRANVELRLGDLTQLGQANASSSLAATLTMAQMAAEPVAAAAGPAAVPGAAGVAAAAAPATLTNRLKLNGRVPLDGEAGNIDLKVNAVLPDMPSVMRFLTIETPRPVAAVTADFQLRGRSGGIDISELQFELGKLRVRGQGRLYPGASPLLDVQLSTEYLDWVQTLLDGGRVLRPPKPPGQLLTDNPLAWPLLEKLGAWRIKAGLDLKTLRLRSGIELHDFKARLDIVQHSLNAQSFSANAFGGRLGGHALFTSPQERLDLSLQASNLSLEKWRDELKKKKILMGGPLSVDATVTGYGSSLKRLAASMSGPVQLRLGVTPVPSPKAAEAESIFTALIPALSGGREQQLVVQCAAANLSFTDGRASGNDIVGARSDMSKLITSGTLDLKAQTLDLHGRVKGADGSKIGASAFVGGIHIGGPMIKPKFSADARTVGGTAARVGAAILTFGLSVVATTIWDSNAPDPCQAVFAKGAGSATPVTSHGATPRRASTGQRAVPRD